VIPIDDTPGAELTPERAFVLQLRRDSVLDAAALQGRIEHVISGRSAVFGSLQEAFEFIRRVLADAPASGGR
jgi:hypothetical protein